jgi:hypothetical protein
MRFTFVILLFLSLDANAQMIIKAHANYRPYAVAVAQNLLLDDYPNAMAAFSVRKLDKDYAGNCLRLRRSNDNTEQDFGFVNNFLDTNSIKTFCSTNNCFVTTWYDQSGNGRNATQSTATNQPFYINAGQANDLLGIRFEKIISVDSFVLRLNVNLPLQNVATIISVNTDPTQNANNSIHKPILAGRDTSVYVVNARGYGFGKLRQGSNGFRFGGPSLGLENSNSIQSPYTQTNTRELIFGVNNQASYSLFKNGVSLGTQTGTNRTGGFITGYSIGASEGGLLDRFYTGRISELIIYGSDQSSNRTGIETNINSYYGIY